ncbi:ABC transporter permease [Cellulomonas bogoriensis]|uniref:Nitrate ABC transporter permease n=1 Tax=Cellulomonas bogoriensis 69B4 = DSM 16987 TaxID=1386082 RepID=A0A0A0C1D7_9CELL|nr:ABC transporter permease [Cellulomonas bogoriensis]KGM13732.1 nitrate ABC transporter permease [Cellulomonas bogoriensis 69B4 = DSM 16987]
MSTPARTGAPGAVDAGSATGGDSARNDRPHALAGSRPRRTLPAPRWGRLALALVVPVTLLSAWHLATAVTGVFAPHQLPAPASVWQAAVELATWDRGPNLWTHVQISTQRVLLGFTLGAALGLAVGAVVGLSRLGDALLSGTFGAVRAVPSLGWVPLLVLWMGINEDSKVTLIAIGAFFPVYTTVASALRHVDKHLVEAGRAYGLRGTSLLVRVQLPAATPAVVSGLRLALAQSWLFLVAAELIASSMGLGFLLIDSQSNGRVDRILLALVVLAVLGKLTDALLGMAERRLLRRF